MIGYGYWGPNIVRNFNGLISPRSRPYATKSDCAPPRRAGLPSLQDHRRSGRNTPLSGDRRGRRNYAGLDSFQLAKAALENGKHVFVEKPFTCSSAQAEQLIELAAGKNLKLCGSHLPVYRRGEEDPSADR